MAGDTWTERPLEEVIDFREGPGILAKDFREHGVPLVRLAGLDRGVTVLEGCNYLDPETVSIRWAHFQLALGDILLSTSASLGRIAVVDEQGVGAVPYTGIIRMRPRDESIHGPFIRYLLEGPDFQQQAEMVGVGSVIRHFGPMHLRQMTLRVPPLPEQRAIAHILGTLDDKIELNRRVNQTLEAMARALFKSWFVDFDPVRAKMEGRDPVLPAHLADLFPDRLVDSELGPIPQGWEVSTIGEEVSVVGGSTPSTKDRNLWDGAINWATPKDLSVLSSPVLIETARQISDAGLSKISSGLLPQGTVLLSSRAPIGYLAIADIPVAVNQGFIAMRCEARLPNVFVWLWTQANMDTILQNANGSTFQEISKRNFRPLGIAIPEPDLLSVFDGHVRPLYEQIVKNQRESRTLAALRDALLPKLVPGKMRAKQVEMEPL